MTATLKIAVSRAHIHCRLSTSQPLASPIFCFSLMAPAQVISGGELVRSVGGYAEVALPDLAAASEHSVVIAYAEQEFRPVNRAWLPLGPYLRHAGGVIALKAGPAGATRWQPPPDAPDAGLGLAPPVSRWRPSGGTRTVGTVSCADRRLDPVDALAKRSGFDGLLDRAGAPLSVATAAGLAPGGYRLTIGAQALDLVAADDAGIRHGAVTLLNLIRLHRGKLPCGTIKDAPRFEWRGMHLDCARHYYAPQTILRLLDQMALLKLNRFHWHFADDEAFRVEIDCLPALWQKTRLRGEGHLLPGLFGGGIEAGGSYSKSDVRQVIDHAATLGIEVMPEIEVPAHALALNAVINGLRDPNDRGRETSVQGYLANVINPAQPKTWEVLESLIDEIAGLFPFPIIHLGCDELPEGSWSGSPLIDALKVKEGLATRDDVQGWMMERVAALVVARGKRPAAWEEAARGQNGGIGHDALLFSWSGQGPGLAAARAGYDVVMCPAQHTYLDMARTDRPDDWGANWAAYVSLGETVNWQPVPDRIADIATRVKGVQGAFWSEFTTRDVEMVNMVWPRLLGVAAAAWCDGATCPDGHALAAIAAAWDRAGLDAPLAAIGRQLVNPAGSPRP